MLLFTQEFVACNAIKHRYVDAVSGGSMGGAMGAISPLPVTAIENYL